MKPELKAWLKRASAARGVSVPEVVEMLLDEAMEREEVQREQVRIKLRQVREGLEGWTEARGFAAFLELRHEETRLQGEVVGFEYPTGCPRCGVPPGVECDERCGK